VPAAVEDDTQGGDVLHAATTDREAGQAVGLLPTLGCSITEEGSIDLPGEVTGQAPSDLCGGLGAAGLDVPDELSLIMEPGGDDLPTEGY
jgi:hypothetical protein